MIGMEQIDQDLAELKAEGETVLEIRMSPTRRRQFYDEIMAAYTALADDLIAAQYRGIPIVVVEDMADDAIIYGLAL